MVVVRGTMRQLWSRQADRIEVLAQQQKCLGKYRRLIRDLRRGAFGERCDERAEAALKILEF